MPAVYAIRAVGGNRSQTADVYSVWVPGHKGGESETVLGSLQPQYNLYDRAGYEAELELDPDAIDLLNRASA